MGLLDIHLEHAPLAISTSWTVFWLYMDSGFSNKPATGEPEVTQITTGACTSKFTKSCISTPKMDEEPTKTSAASKSEEPAVSQSGSVLEDPEIPLPKSGCGFWISLVVVILALLTLSIFGCYYYCAPDGKPSGYDIENQRDHRASMCPTRQWPPRQSRQSGYKPARSRSRPRG